MRRINNQVRQRRRQTWLDLPAHGIEEAGHGKSNADIQREKRTQEKALLDRFGAEKRSLIVSKALADASQVPGKHHDCEEWQETASTFLINLAAVPTEESARFAVMSRPVMALTEKQSRQLEEFAKTGVEFQH